MAKGSPEQGLVVRGASFDSGELEKIIVYKRLG